jgi:BolA protein
VKRHQVIYRLLSEQLSGPVHALALHTYTADEWAQKMQKSPEAPKCRGGEH